MEQFGMKMAPHILQETWSFEPPEAPMRGHCPACLHSVTVVRPRVDDIRSGCYVVRGECKECGSEVVLDIPGVAD